VIRVLLAEDHTVVRHGLEQLLGDAADIEVVGAAADGAEAVELVAERRPDVVLMDLEMPRMDGVAATRAIVGGGADARVVVLTSFSDREDVLKALDAGAVGYLLKDAPPEELLAGIRSAARDELPLAPRAARELVGAWRGTRGSTDMTAREMDVLVLLADGLPNKVIARHLGISEKTVKAHVTQIFQALGVTDRTQAALWVSRNGLSAHWQARRERLRAGQGDQR
jgi:DNA-binding NarL/FixJ family response regulator